MMPQRSASVRDAALNLLSRRAADATICPSEVARALAAASGKDVAADAWRGAMPAVHAAIDQLVADGVVRLRWKGETLPRRDGPYRIARGPRFLFTFCS